MQSEKNKATEIEITFTLASMLIGIGVLAAPRLLAMHSEGIDACISIILAALLTAISCWCIAKLAARFPGMNFYEYSRTIVTQPIALILVIAMTLFMMLFAAYEARAIAVISRQYLFDHTPVEVIALTFLMIVSYAVLGSRIAIIRLNLMFLPIVVCTILFILAFSSNIIEINNLKPFLVTPWQDIMKGMKDSLLMFIGFSVLLSYISLMKRPEKAPSAAMYGLLIIVVLYVVVYIVVIGVLSNMGTEHVLFPTLELAKEVRIPGDYFERLESLFFVIFIMTIFNSATMAYDTAMLSLHSVIGKGKKIHYVFWLSPIIFLTALFPQDVVELWELGELLVLISLFLGYSAPVVLLFIATVRGLKGDVNG
ncbi:GerAB/ArcD/ProY family transporter [Paenibacillus abyssi]|uniref:Germination protein GerLB n=1 Tax=Paenibacillus abyssi TaxID=1340531 RepID=A0A917CVZ7_9BACL|nr:endospore germination permease [Paenibacillus abyssi]GGF99514.1 germination protein GerLB [Paenibacillus abyssi]